MTSAPTPAASTWTVTSVLEQAYMMARDNFAAFVTVTLVFGAVALVMDILSLGLLAGIVHLVVSVATAICLTWGALQVIAGRKPQWEPMMRQLQGPMFGRLLLLGCLQYFVIAVSAIVVVGPLILIPLWAVAIPAMMIEHLGVGDSLQRSMDLTAGRRLRILGAFILLIVILAIGAWVIMLLLGFSPIAHLVMWVYSAVASTVVQPLSAIIYVLLREEKEGAVPAQVAAGA
jgi:hypothetical protein